MASVVCNCNCRQANLYDLPASKPTLADMIHDDRDITASCDESPLVAGPLIKATSVDMVQSMIRPSRSIVSRAGNALVLMFCLLSSAPHLVEGRMRLGEERSRLSDTLSSFIHAPRR